MTKTKIGYLIIASAIIWGIMIIGTASILKGTPYKDDVGKLLLFGSVFHLLFIWVPLGRMFKNKKRDKKVDKTKNS
ncbi:MAG: hypothetical protein P9M11_07785 [Candidatus Tenebribacter burtonii]|jgi:hypothetical protein|nr:hypothetical protein [Candidatus Tenebribacter burtonii]